MENLGHHNQADTLMTKTERLLQEAQQIAGRTFPNPSERAVMDVFHELCSERDLTGPGHDERDGATLH